MDTEDTFIAAMDAAQEYLALRQQLAEELRSGFMNLAVARYGMGPDRVSVAQLPSSMAATVKLQQGTERKTVSISCMLGTTGNGILKLLNTGEGDELTLGSATENHGAAATATEREAKAAPSQDASSNNIDKDDIIAQLGSKYCCDFERNPDTDTEDEMEVSGVKDPRNPISWYGSVVSPALRETQRDFSAALNTIVQLVNVQRRLEDKLDTFKTKSIQE